MTTALTHMFRAAAAVAVLLGASTAAAGPSISDKATARSLFDEARALVKAGKTEQACPKFKESYNLDPGPGSAFHLADCYEQTGRFATSWVLFLEVAVLMRDAGDKDKEAAARRRADALAPRLSRLTIEVPAEHAIDGLTIVRDGEKVGAGSWNTALPVDAGEHSVTVSAPGREAWSTTVMVGSDAAKEKVTVPLLPALAKDTAEPVAQKLPPTVLEHQVDEPSGMSSQQITGLIVAGSGALVFGVGTFLGFNAKSNYDDSEPYCDGNLCTQQGLDIRSDARGDANLATIVGGIGLAALAGGAVLYFTAPGAKTGSSDLAAGVGPGSVMVKGAW